MEAEEYGRIAAVEDEHWWYDSTRSLCAELLAPWLGIDQTLLDAGCGPGGNGAWLARHGTVVGLDRSDHALAFVRDRRASTRPVQGDVTALPFRDSTFDAAIEITVGYAVPDDWAMVEELARVTRPGGVVLLVEPALAWLWRAHDETVHGIRRYRRSELVDRAERAGLQVQRSTYCYSFLTPAAGALALIERVRPQRASADSPDRQDASTTSDVQRRTLDRVFEPLAVLERRWLRRHRVPFGTSVLVVATRPE